MTADHLQFPKTSLVKTFARGRFHLATIAGILTAITATGARRVVKALPVITHVTPVAIVDVEIECNKTKDDETIVITPAETMESLDIALPLSENARVGQIIRIHSSQIVSSFGMANANVAGAALSALAADTPYALQCISLTGFYKWLRIQ